jgi:hypothetical protein
MYYLTTNGTDGEEKPLSTRSFTEKKRENNPNSV